MSESRFESYPKHIVEFEEDIDKLKLNTSDDTKKLIDLSVMLSKKMEDEVNKIINQISSMIEKDTQDYIQKLRTKYYEERDKKVAQLRESANKNYERAVSYILEVIKGAYK